MVKRIWKIRASSIVEVVVAFVIIALSISLTTMFLGQIMANTKRVEEFKGWYVLNEYITHVHLTMDIEEAVQVYENFTIIKESVCVDEEKNLWKVTFEINNQEEKVLVSRSLLIKGLELENNEE